MLCIATSVRRHLPYIPTYTTYTHLTYLHVPTYTTYTHLTYLHVPTYLHPPTVQIYKYLHTQLPTPRYMQVGVGTAGTLQCTYTVPTSSLRVKTFFQDFLSHCSSCHKAVNIFNSFTGQPFTCMIHFIHILATYSMHCHTKKQNVGYWSTNVQFCSGSNTSNRAADGSPWRLLPCETKNKYAL